MHVRIVALQAVMAVFMSGDTIHNALILPVFGKNGSKPFGDKSEMKTVKAILQLRWLIIDGMLADKDTKLRSVARAVDLYVIDEQQA